MGLIQLNNQAGGMQRAWVMRVGVCRGRMGMPPPLAVAAMRRRKGTALFPPRRSWKPSKHPSMDVPASMAIKKLTQKLPRVEYAKKILAFAMAINYHEVHSVHHVEEGEEGKEC